MMTNAALRLALRPHGMTAPGCHKCGYFSRCGGIETAFSLCDCQDLFCCHSDDCDMVCPNSPSFVQRCEEVKGLRFDNLSPVIQRPIELPLYIPVIKHQYSRSGELDNPIVAVSTYDLLRRIDGKYVARVDSGEKLRAMLKLSVSTRILLLGVAKDPHLERYWELRRRDGAAEQLAKLQPDLAIGPNYSHFLNVPRTEILFNRKRQLVCLEELQAAGIDVVPHLSAVMPGDWKFWREFLRDNKQITIVAKEFQTGNKARKQGVESLDKLAEIQDRIGRAIHPILIGAAQFAGDASQRFETFTVMDSRPFMEAIHRRMGSIHGRRVQWRAEPRLPSFGIDDHLSNNIAAYSAWLYRRAHENCRSRRYQRQVPA